MGKSKPGVSVLLSKTNAGIINAESWKDNRKSGHTFLSQEPARLCDDVHAFLWMLITKISLSL